MPPLKRPETLCECFISDNFFVCCTFAARPLGDSKSCMLSFPDLAEFMRLCDLSGFGGLCPAADRVFVSFPNTEK